MNDLNSSTDKPNVLSQSWNNSIKSDGDFLVLAPPIYRKEIKFISLCIIIIVTLLGNGFILRHIFTDRRRLTATNIYILSQCIADIATAVLVMPFAGVSVLQGWIFGRKLMIAHGFFNMFFTVVTLLHLGVIALDRYFAVVRVSHHLMNKRNAVWVVLGLWAVAFLTSFPWLPLLSDNVIIDYFPGFYACGQRFLHPQKPFEISLFLLDCLVIIGCPLSIIMFSFYQIAKKIRHSRRSVLPLTLSNMQKQSVATYAKSAYTSFIVVFTSLFQVFPSCMMIAVEGLQIAKIPNDVATIAKWIMWCHCCVKPLIYMYRKKFSPLRNRRFTVYRKSYSQNSSSSFNSKRNYLQKAYNPAFFIASHDDNVYVNKQKISGRTSEHRNGQFDDILAITDL